jgi:hypothetical protein
MLVSHFHLKMTLGPLLKIFKDFLWELSIAVVAAILLSGFFDEKVLISLTRSSLVLKPIREMCLRLVKVYFFFLSFNCFSVIQQNSSTNFNFCSTIIYFLSQTLCQECFLHLSLYLSFSHTHRQTNSLSQCFYKLPLNISY